jgi:hypothetical protein
MRDRVAGAGICVCVSSNGAPNGSEWVLISESFPVFEPVTFVPGSEWAIALFEKLRDMPKKSTAKNTTFGADLIEGMNLVLAHQRGKIKLEQVWPKPIDVKTIRKRVKKTGE